MDNKFSIVNLNEFSWHLNVALMGAAFSVFALVYNEYFIYYGLITFAFGVFAHIASIFTYWIFSEPAGTHSKFGWVAHIVNILFGLLWIVAILFVY